MFCFIATSEKRLIQAVRMCCLICEYSLYLSLAIIKNRLQVVSDPQPMQTSAETAEWKGIANVIDHTRPFRARLENMRVLPKTIRAFFLHIYKFLYRLPDQYACSPTHRQTAPSYEVINACILFHPDWLGGSDLEAKPYRGDPFQVSRFPEKREHVVDGPRDNLLAMNLIGFHDLY
jgi:hypothetical protein